MTSRLMVLKHLGNGAERPHCLDGNILRRLPADRSLLA